MTSALKLITTKRLVQHIFIQNILKVSILPEKIEIMFKHTHKFVLSRIKFDTKIFI